MASDPRSGERINLFSLVTYLPEPLGSFIDQLRGELVPGCSLRAHVTVLPPRPLSQPAEVAGAKIRSKLAEFEPFELRLEEVEIFTMSSVVYLALTKGADEMRRLHDALNVDAAPFNEPFPFHPHVTLAQQISAEQVPDVFEHARYRWAEFAHKRSFLVDHATFVQAINLYCWVDLEECPLGSRPRP
jgi:2'-5' RNA ligase